MEHPQIETFTIKIRSRERGTWHGEVTWAEEGKKKNFRNTMELIRLIDSTAIDNEGRTWNENDNTDY